MASELGVEGLVLLVHRGMPVLLAPFGDRREAPTEPLAHRSHLHCELPSPAACPNVRQPKEVEGAGFLLSPPVPTENSIGLKKREQHLERERIPRSQKTLVESQSCEPPAVSAPGAEDHRRGVCAYIKEEAIAHAARRSYRW